jgi:hypothetical protein
VESLLRKRLFWGTFLEELEQVICGGRRVKRTQFAFVITSPLSFFPWLSKPTMFRISLKMTDSLNQFKNERNSFQGNPRF